MSGDQAIMERYETALTLTRSMLEAAQKSDWDLLVQLERNRTGVINELKDLDRDPSRDAANRARKTTILREMMELDAQIEILTQDWMRELRDVLGSINAEQRLTRTYGT